MLKQNTTLAAQYPYRLRGGGGAAQMRSMQGRTERTNQYASEGIGSTRAAVPNGHLAPSAWLLPQVAGGLSSRNEAVGLLTTAGAGSAGRNLVANSLLVLTTAGNAAAVASLSGSASLVITASGTIVAPLSMVGSATLSLVASGSMGGIASITGSATALVTTSIITKANGFMIAVPISQELTPDAIASSVWAALAAANNTTGSMGNKLNSAASGGVDLDALAQAVWEYVTRDLTGVVPANIKKVNDIDVVGDGTDNNPWNPA